MSKVSFSFEHNLIFIPVTLTHQEKNMTFQRCILDTGAAGTTFEVTLAEQIGLAATPESQIRFITGIGGRESVYIKTVQHIQIGHKALHTKKAEFGDLQSSFHIDGIIGNDLLQNFKIEICYRSKTLSLTEY